jgi:hypothetical protein
VSLSLFAASRAGPHLQLTCNSTTQIVAVIDFFLGAGWVWYLAWGVINGVLFGIAGFRGENDPRGWAPGAPLLTHTVGGPRDEDRRKCLSCRGCPSSGGRCLAMCAALLAAPQVLVVLVVLVVPVLQRASDEGSSANDGASTEDFCAAARLVLLLICLLSSCCVCQCTACMKTGEQCGHPPNGGFNNRNNANITDKVQFLSGKTAGWVDAAPAPDMERGAPVPAVLFADTVSPAQPQQAQAQALMAAAPANADP